MQIISMVIFYTFILVFAFKGFHCQSQKAFLKDFSCCDRVCGAFLLFSIVILLVGDKQEEPYEVTPLIFIVLSASILVWYIGKYNENKRKENLNEVFITMGIMFVAVCQTIANSQVLIVNFSCNIVVIFFPTFAAYQLTRHYSQLSQDKINDIAQSVTEKHDQK